MPITPATGSILHACSHADLSSGDEQVDRSSLTVADGVQFGVHAALGATNQATTPPFLTAMLVAARWAFK